jgi:hypothetical protein
MQYLALCVWIILFNILSFSSTHFTANNITACDWPIYYIYDYIYDRWYPVIYDVYHIFIQSSAG